jgi:inner membrane protein
MDSVTHLALGACMGEVMAGKKLGKKSLLLGAVANSLPDIDSVAALWLPPHQNLLAHRGITHSFFFILLLSPLLALAARKYYRHVALSLRQWTFFFGLELLAHVLLDAFNAYGTGWFEPFSAYRVSFDTLFVMDPFFSLVLVVAAIALIAMHKGHVKRLRYAWLGLVLAAGYLLYSLYNKVQVNKQVERSLAVVPARTKAYFSTPTPFNCWLWFVAAATDSGYYVGYRSVFDRRQQIDFRYFPQNRYLLRGRENEPEISHLVRFARGYYTLELIDNELIFNDLRFGQIAGWYQPDAPFSFHYAVKDTSGNTLVVQRGRFTGWNKAVVRSMVSRILAK